MRVVSVVIGLAVVAYIGWEVVHPLPASATHCPYETECGGPPVQDASSQAPPRGLQIELYDPAMEPGRRYEDEKPHATWISSAEVDLAVSGGDDVVSARRQGRGFGVRGLGQPGSRGFCLVLDHGARRCLAFISEPRE